ncbi:MAG: STAS domain-containing protein [Pseudomonadota bacterium]
MNIKTRQETTASVFEVLDDRIDSSIAVDFKDYVCRAIDSGQYDVVLDLSRVDFVDSSGIGAIVGVFKHLGTRGTFSVAGLTRSVARVFQLTRMDKVFQVYPSVEEALAGRSP